MIALVVLSARKSVMGEYVQTKITSRMAAAATLLIVLLNIVLLSQLLG
jgi:manganese transport protein